MQKTFTVEEIKKYILSQDSLGDVMYNLNEANIIKANKKKRVPLKYYISLDERGSFLADVRRDGETIFEIKAGNELEPGESSVFEDGFMKHKEDISGLTEYLYSLGLITREETIEFGN